MAFLGGGLSIYSNTVTHENILVFRNKFTYLDAELGVPGTPDVPVVPDNPAVPDKPVLPTDAAGKDYTPSDSNNRKDIPTEPSRPVHPNGVLISFGPLSNAKNIWRNVFFSENVIYLQGPGHCAVGMYIVRGEYQDEYHNVKFFNNSIYHTYHDSGQQPGNGANHYLYTSSFSFQILPNTEGLSLLADTEKGTVNACKDVQTDAMVPGSYSAENETELVSYFGNSIFYSQQTRDYSDPKAPSYRLAYEHSCFKLSLLYDRHFMWILEGRGRGRSYTTKREDSFPVIGIES